MFPQADDGAKSLCGLKLAEKTESSVTLEFSVPDTNAYFDGHFPGCPILPAAAQMDLIIGYASQYFGGAAIDVSEMKRIKFTNLIRPSTPLVLRIEKKESMFSFKLHSPDHGTVYSTGTFEIREGSR